MGVTIVGGFIWPTYSASKEIFPVGMNDVADYEPPSKGPWWLGNTLVGAET